MANADQIDLDNPIPVLSNRMILKFMELDLIDIKNFRADRLAPSSYRLNPGRVRFYSEHEDGFLLVDQVLDLSGGNTRIVAPGEYVVISPTEKISVKPGVVADFYPSSFCIENRLAVTSGRLDAGYDFEIVFGVFNAGRGEVRITSGFQLMRASFSWLGNFNMPSYEGDEPGGYIPRMRELRAEEQRLEAGREELEERLKNIRKLREELEGKS